MNRLIQKIEDLVHGYPVLGSAARSPKWPEVERAFLKDHPTCAVCGTKKDLNVHHEVPFHLDHSRELDPTNLITLCREHHFLFGHLLNWASFNKDVETDSSLWNTKIKNRP